MRNMYYYLTCLIALFTLYANAQAPQSIPYQAVARTTSGNLLVNQTVGIRFTVHDITANGTILFQERQTPTTNTLGLFSVNVGTGTLLSGNFSTINWASGAKFLQVELDPAGGTSYTNMGASQMQSVPFALFAGGAAPTGAAGGDLTGTYPNPTIDVDAVNSSKIQDGTVSNADLVNSSLTVTAGTGLSGGGSVALGSSTTLSMPSVITAASNVGNATTVPQITYDAQGRLTSVTPVTISGVTPSGPAGGDLTGTYPNPTIAASAVGTTEIADGTVGTADITDGSITGTDIAAGSIPNADLTNSSITVTAGTGLSGGGTVALGGSTTLSLPSVITAASAVGNATTVPQLTYDAQGRLTTVNTVTISGTAPGGTAGGDLSGTYPNPTVAKVNGATVPAAGALTTGNVLQVTGASTLGYAPVDLDNGANYVTGILPVGNGGTGLATYTIGDIPYASAATTIAKLADVATGNALISGGVGVAPSYGKIGLTTHVSGILPIANGGTNTSATPTNGGVTYGTGSAQAYSAVGTSGQVLQSNGAAAPTWVANGVMSGITVYTSGSGTYTVPAGVTKLYVRMLGAGGAGGSAQFSSCSGTYHVGSGGGAGGYLEGFIASPAATYSYAVGAGGTANVTTCGSAGGVGGTGGTTTFGTALYTANGGFGGVNSQSGTAWSGGAGGSASGGSLNLSGARGGGSSGNTYMMPGYGAGSFFGDGAMVYPNFQGNIAGTAATVPGTGGAGASNYNSATWYAGGTGAAGIIIIYEYK